MGDSSLSTGSFLNPSKTIPLELTWASIASRHWRNQEAKAKRKEWDFSCFDGQGGRSVRQWRCYHIWESPASSQGHPWSYSWLCLVRDSIRWRHGIHRYVLRSASPWIFAVTTIKGYQIVRVIPLLNRYGIYRYVFWLVSGSINIWFWVVSFAVFLSLFL